MHEKSLLLDHFPNNCSSELYMIIYKVSFDPANKLANVTAWLKSSEPPHEESNNTACAPSEYSDQPGHPPSLIGVFALRMKKAWVLSYPFSAQRRLWSDWADAQAELSL